MLIEYWFKKGVIKLKEYNVDLILLTETKKKGFLVPKFE